MNSTLDILHHNYNYKTTMAKEILLRKKMKRPLVANLGKLYFVPLTNSLFRIENALLMKYLYFITIPVF